MFQIRVKIQYNQPPLCVKFSISFGFKRTLKEPFLLQPKWTSLSPSINTTLAASQKKITTQKAQPATEKCVSVRPSSSRRCPFRTAVAVWMGPQQPARWDCQPGYPRCHLSARIMSPHLRRRAARCGGKSPAPDHVSPQTSERSDLVAAACSSVACLLVAAFFWQHAGLGCQVKTSHQTVNHPLSLFSKQKNFPSKFRKSPHVKTSGCCESI